jgi:hypothetical protein
MQNQRQKELHKDERGTRLIGAMNPLRDDWKPAVCINKTAAPGRTVPPKCLPPEPEPDPIDQQVAIKQLRSLREALKGSAV